MPGPMPGPSSTPETESRPSPVLSTDPAEDMVVLQDRPAQGSSGSSAMDGKIRITAFLCQKLGIDLKELLTADIVSHPEFMTALASIAASCKEYYTLCSTRQTMHHFSKANSLLSQKVHFADVKLADLKVDLIDLASLKIVAGNLSVQLKCCQEKLTKIMSLLPLLFDVKAAVDDAIGNLQCSVRAQKARKFNKKTGHGEYKFIASNSLTLTWQEAQEKINDMEPSSFSPLTKNQVTAFPWIKDMCHHKGLEVMSECLIRDQFSLSDDKVKDAINQLVELFPLLLIQKAGYRILLDYTELVFCPDIVHELLTLDSRSKPTEEGHAGTQSRT